jgi:hypothetical protein
MKDYFRLSGEVASNRERHSGCALPFSAPHMLGMEMQAIEMKMETMRRRGLALTLDFV